MTSQPYLSCCIRACRVQSSGIETVLGFTFHAKFRRQEFGFPHDQDHGSGFLLPPHTFAKAILTSHPLQTHSSQLCKPVEQNQITILGLAIRTCIFPGTFAGTDARGPCRAVICRRSIHATSTPKSWSRLHIVEFCAEFCRASCKQHVAGNTPRPAQNCCKTERFDSQIDCWTWN